MPRLLEFIRAVLRRNWRRALRVREHLLLSEEAFHLAMAGVVGVAGGLVNFAFYLCIDAVKSFALHHHGDLGEAARMLDWWLRILIPTGGGLAAGLVLYWGFRLVKQTGSTNLLEVVVAGDGRLRFRSAVVKAVSSLLSIGTGASIGREGAITQLTATVASKWGQLAKWPPYRLRLLVACGASAGIAAAYNAPIAGAVFAAQIVLGNFAMNLFAPLIFASVVAAVMSRSFFGIAPWYSVPAFDFTRLTQLPWFVLLGVLSGALGVLFLKMLRRSETLFNRLPVPLYLRLALAGLIVGGIAVEFPEVWGNGYGATNRILHETLGPHALQFIVGLFLAKLIATSATVGAGTVGGVFTPTLFLGAALGSAFGLLLHSAGWAVTLPTGAFALVGMGSVLAATTHSPLLAMILVFEISLNYSLMPALMLACAVASLFAKQLHPDTIYTEPLRAKGLEAAPESTRLGAATQQTVGDLMQPPVPPVRDHAPLPDIAARFLASTYNFLPVVDAGGRLVGVVALQDLKEHLNAGAELNSVIALDVMRPPPPVLTPGQSLLDALPVLLASELRNIPVVNDAGDRRLVGAVVRAEALGLVSEAIDQSTLMKI
ncbi:MAG: ClcB-like voltage-gated chloride channel protein [Verrucomicrobia bacterium]|nr:ClcB-like voltage-gated chloride channel protein [Verrucomicrobiota bacterium]